MQKFLEICGDQTMKHKTILQGFYEFFFTIRGFHAVNQLSSGCPRIEPGMQAP